MARRVQHEVCQCVYHNLTGGQLHERIEPIREQNMTSNLSIDHLPLLWIFVLTIVLILLSLAAGMRLGAWQSKRSQVERDAPVGSTVGAMLGLLAFMLAFTFGMTASRFEARKLLLIEEVNAIGTAYLRAGLLPEPHGGEIRKLLREYAGVRVAVFQEPKRLREGLSKSEELHDRLWDQASAIARADLDSRIGALFIESLNKVIDLHTTRVTVGFLHRIPSSIWIALYLVAILSMAALGYQFGLSGGSGLQICLVLALAFSVVIVLIEDLDRPGEGSLRVSQKPMIELQQKLDANPP
jgi:hypothetical protein